MGNMLRVTPSSRSKPASEVKADSFTGKKLMSRDAKTPAPCSFEDLPRRLFLDSSALQNLETYGECIYDGGDIGEHHRIRSVPDGVGEIEALRKIMLVGQRGCFELVLSNNSFLEVEASGRVSYLGWAHEVHQYWQDLLSNYAYRGVAPFSGQGKTLAGKLETPRFGYLSNKDRFLIRDAVLLECDAFITMDKRLARNGRHIEKELRLKVLSPSGYWSLLAPWAALYV
jgi:hypothetical protein